MGDLALAVLIVVFGFVIGLRRYRLWEEKNRKCRGILLESLISKDKISESFHEETRWNFCRSPRTRRQVARRRKSPSASTSSSFLCACYVSGAILDGLPILCFTFLFLFSINTTSRAKGRCPMSVRKRERENTESVFFPHDCLRCD